MRKREREITLLYGMSLIRDDVLNHPLPKHSAKDRLIIFMHYAFAFTSVITLAVSSIILILSFIPTTG
ncbi:Uncharacterised protein [Enterobacter hormaechei]|nr:Uncharacterised protein [Enterobacter hormaechei]CZY63617.1 Uncharacterised protein [Enterobacter hormaechei]CZY73075.1 Uncharacterised protein [Enterobacter hormaechei]SAF36302.1 Uncharacterised protein [Enterobacter hormaechei]